MKQGEIWITDLNPIKGSEQAGKRPVVIISGNLLNQHLNVVIAAPLTTKINRYKGNPVLKPTKTNGLLEESEILVFHIRSISKERFIQKLGNIEKDQLAMIIKTLQDILKY
ncbi:MAG TPA: type II toxin-antitoxin system PemK/MazF family toxin [Cyclobacteriaceae bacterium]|nr:type II toxin-antitoxin system PemK/MazF family toxin [Cyclobacteriaceae bacterium]HRJ83588.1 type II toxin-antitoxin system PemK/MazF family toxin [Cyclobacteriaceae bacterium]